MAIMVMATEMQEVEAEGQIRPRKYLYLTIRRRYVINIKRLIKLEERLNNTHSRYRYTGILPIRRRTLKKIMIDSKRSFWVFFSSGTQTQEARWW